jgi:hypothetical protein
LSSLISIEPLITVNKEQKGQPGMRRTSNVSGGAFVASKLPEAYIGGQFKKVIAGNTNGFKDYKNHLIARKGSQGEGSMMTMLESSGDIPPSASVGQRIRIEDSMSNFSLIKPFMQDLQA